jgi:hypothetical protein
MHLASILILGTLLQPATTPAITADQLARDVMKASGADAWPKVTRIKFTFNVERPDGKRMSRAHDWDIAAGTDTVTFNGKTITAKLSAGVDQADEDSKNAFAAWTNDSYWLLAPLKVMDGGVIRSVKPDETIDGKTYHVLHLSFQNVGMTPTDQYDLFIDPQSKLVRHWTYIPAGGEPRRFTWDAYQSIHGLNLSTEHRIGDKLAITFTDVSATLSR